MDGTADGNLIAYGDPAGRRRTRSWSSSWTSPRRKELPDVLPRARYQGHRRQERPQRRLLLAAGEGRPARLLRARSAPIPRRTRSSSATATGRRRACADLSDDNRWLVMQSSPTAPAAMKTEVYVRDLAAGRAASSRSSTTSRRASPRTSRATRCTWRPNLAGAQRARPRRGPRRIPRATNGRRSFRAGNSAIQGVSTVRRADLRAIPGKRPAANPDLRPAGKAAGRNLLPPIGSASDLRGEWGKNEAFFTFSSFVTPTTIYRYDIAKGTREVWAKESVPIARRSLRSRAGQVRLEGRHADPDVPRPPEGHEARRIEPGAPDRIRRLQAPQTPGFSARAALWVENGGVYALPQPARRRRVRRGLAQGGHAREEAERLRRLHRRGGVADQERVHLAFQARDLRRLQRRIPRGRGPDAAPGPLRRGRLLLSRCLDMVRYQKFLVAGYWVPEYGSGDNPEQFPFLYAYSPYHRVKAGTKYPAVLFITGDSDTRVAPPRAQDGRAAPGLDRLRQARPSPLRHQGRPLRRNHASVTSASKSSPTSLVPRRRDRSPPPTRRHRKESRVGTPPDASRRASRRRGGPCARPPLLMDTTRGGRGQAPPLRHPQSPRRAPSAVGGPGGRPPHVWRLVRNSISGHAATPLLVPRFHLDRHCGVRSYSCSRRGRRPPSSHRHRRLRGRPSSERRSRDSSVVASLDTPPRASAFGQRQAMAIDLPVEERHPDRASGDHVHYAPSVPSRIWVRARSPASLKLDGVLGSSSSRAFW